MATYNSLRYSLSLLSMASSRNNEVVKLSASWFGDHNGIDTLFPISFQNTLGVLFGVDIVSGRNTIGACKPFEL